MEYVYLTLKIIGWIFAASFAIFFFLPKKTADKILEPKTARPAKRKREHFKLLATLAIAFVLWHAIGWVLQYVAQETINVLMFTFIFLLAWFKK